MESLNNLIDAFPDGVLVTDRAGNILELNFQTAVTLGYSRFELLGQSMEMLIHEDYRERHRAFRDDFIRAPRFRPMDSGLATCARRRDGSMVPVDISCCPFQRGGELVVVHVIRDMTERRRTEEAIRQSESRYRELVDATPSLVHQTSVDGRIFFANKAWTDRLGFQPTSETPVSVFSILSPSSVIPFRSVFERVLTSDRVDGVEAEFVSAAGERIRVKGTVLPRIENGCVAGTLAFFQDVSEEKRAERQLRHSEMRLAHAQRMARLGNWEVRFDGAPPSLLDGNWWWSDELYRIMGVDRSTFIPTTASFLACVHAERRREVIDAFEKLLGSGAPMAIEFVVVRGDGTERQVRQHAEPVPSEDDSVRISGIVQDITDYKELEDQLSQSQKLESIGRLAGGIAHDFNNLLTVINGYSSLLLRGVEKSDPMHPRLMQISKAADQAAALTSQLLAFSRKQIMQPTSLDLNECVREVAGMLQRIIGDDIRLTPALSHSLGQVTADANQIKQILMNLVANARDAMPDGGTITIETENVFLDDAYVQKHPQCKPGHYVGLTVSDTGVGMDERTQKHAFEPFFTTKEEGRGTGLGLATVYGIVKQSGGWIWLYSEIGKGSVFRIYLPRTDEVRSVAEGGDEVSPRMRGTETVLVVEDQDQVREFACSVLEMHGYAVLEAASGEDALELSRRFDAPIQLLLTDLVMRGMNGRDLAVHLRESRPETVTLFMSGYTKQVIARNGMLEPGIQYLQKPFDADTLLSRIRSLLDTQTIARGNAG